jgi:hypothetical protein
MTRMNLSTMKHLSAFLPLAMSHRFSAPISVVK